MKKLIAVASLCIVAVVALPTAASAFTGTCTLEGTAKIYKAGGFAVPEALPILGKEPRNYEFKTTAKTGKCVGTGGTAEPVEAEVKGEGNLGCKESESTVFTSGNIELSENGKKREIKTFSFTGTGTQVKFKAEGPFVKGLTGTGPAEGEASFAADTSGLQKCAAGTATELKFKATTSGEIT